MLLEGGTWHVMYHGSAQWHLIEYKITSRIVLP